MSLRKSPPLTPQLLAATRQNAQHSTGPRSAAAQQNSKLNALNDGRWYVVGGGRTGFRIRDSGSEKAGSRCHSRIQDSGGRRAGADYMGQGKGPILNCEL
jgi:hypothetical protein